MNSSSFPRNPGSLPTPLSPRIGRDREIREVTNLFRREQTRLVTLTGPGGVGKTRLAIEISRRFAENDAREIRFVDLSAVQDPDLVIPAIIQAFEVSTGSQSIQALATILASRPNTLLILDNFEHVLDAAPALSHLLTDCPGLSMLATSRESLKIGGEQEYPVDPLPLPSPSHSPDLAHLAETDSIQLFVVRAQAISPSFELTTENAETIAAICNQLDGLPLAIELAAARIKALPVDILLARLDHRLPLLVGDRRDAPERQQTMRNTIAWSSSLLTPAEQTLFRRLGVYVDGFSLDAAETVCSDGFALGEILDVLGSLVDKSLVRLDPAAPAGPRYFMLETIREFAADQLRASDEHVAVRDAHASWCIALAEKRQVHGNIWSEPPGETSTIPPVATEIGNIRAALEWLAESGDLSELARLAGSAFWYWHEHGPRSEALRWLRLSRKSVPESKRDRQSRMWAMEGLSLIARNAGHFQEATEAANECYALATEMHDTLGESTALGFLGFIVLGEGKYDQSAHFARLSLEKRSESDIGWPTSVVISLQGGAALGKGDLASARDLFEQALLGQRIANDSYDIATLQGWLSLIDSAEGRWTDGAARLKEALSVWLTRRSQEAIAEWLANVSVLALAAGDHQSSARFLAAGMILRDAVGHAFALPERAIYERTERSLRESFGSGEFDRLSADPALQRQDQVLDEAAEFLSHAPDQATSSSPIPGPLPFGLTPRELDVLHHLVQGKTDRDIADALYIGPRTVQTHVSNLLAKLEVSNRAEATAVAIRNGLV